MLVAFCFTGLMHEIRQKHALRRDEIPYSRTRFLPRSPFVTAIFLPITPGQQPPSSRSKMSHSQGFAPESLPGSSYSLVHFQTSGYFRNLTGEILSLKAGTARPSGRRGQYATRVCGNSSSCGRASYGDRWRCGFGEHVAGCSGTFLDNGQLEQLQQRRG